MWSTTGLILGLSPTNERRRYFVTTSLIGWVQTQDQPCTMSNNFWQWLKDVAQTAGKDIDWHIEALKKMFDILQKTFSDVFSEMIPF